MPAPPDEEAGHAQGPTSHRRRRLLFSAMGRLATTLGGAVLSLINVIIVARVLGPTGRGEVVFLATITTFTTQFSAAGLHVAAATFAPREPARLRAIVGTVLALGPAFGVLAAVVVGAAFVVFPGLSPDVPAGLLALALAGVPILIAQLCLQQLLLAHYRFGVVNAGWALGPVVNLSVNGALAAAGALTVTSAFATWLGGQVLACVLYAVTVLRHIARPGRPERGEARRLLRFGVLTQGTAVLYATNYRVDQWILGGLAGERALGVYSVAVAWSELLFYLPTAVQAVQQPDVVRATPEQARRDVTFVLRVTWLVTALMAVVMIAAAPLLCGGVFGEEFAGAAGQLRVLALGALGIAALKLLGDALTAQRRPKLELIALAVTAVGVVGLDVALIPSMEGMGAAIASAVGYTAGGLAAVVLFSRALGGRVRDVVPRPADAAWAWARVGGLLRVRR